MVSEGEPGMSKDLFRGEQPSLWKFHEHGVTSSFLNSYLTCKEQTRLCYVEGWGSRTVPLAFEFGTACHWILEQAYQPAKMADRRIPTAEWIKEQVLTY